MVGSVMLEVLAEQQFPFTELLLVASENSVGKQLTFQGKQYAVIGLQTAIDAAPDIAIFSAGGDTSTEWAPRFAEKGTVVIDNSSAWRMDPTKKLIVPEINGQLLTKQDLIIANPNCSTIQLVMVLAPLHQKYGVKRVVVSTYQSITGTGVKAVQQLANERAGISGEMAYKHPIDQNCIPQCDVFLDNGYTKEEMKLHHETKKILGDSRVQVSATAVRVPVQGGHSESVLITFHGARPSLPAVRQILAAMPGLVVQDDPANLSYPMPRNAEGRDEVFVGRIREDLVCDRSIHLWIVSDNLRKGAATNAVQIAEHLVSAGFLQTPLPPGH